MTENIKVAVRLRPFSERERKMTGIKKCVKMEGQMCKINYMREGIDQEKQFIFDYCYDSSETNLNAAKDQEEIYNDMGKPLVEAAGGGYNSCIFAYGQTGAGKSYTMLGGPGTIGVIPRFIKDLFDNLVKNSGAAGFKECRVWVSSLEDYNETLHDLLASGTPQSKQKDKLQIVEHPKYGSVVLGLTEAPVRSVGEFQRLLDYGTKRRTVACTNMNAVSSRSHVIYSVRIAMIPQEGFGNVQVEARVNLVDLAGSERSEKTESSGQRLKEGGSINKSLTILAQVISELSENTDPSRHRFIPFRSSKLTFLLKSSLCGNSKTKVIVGLSPSPSEADETLSTLRFARSVKKVSTTAVANKGPKNESVAALKKEIERLKAELETAPSNQQCVESLKAVQHMVDCNEDYDEKLKNANLEMIKRMEFLENMGIHVPDSSQYANVTKSTPYLLNVSEDPTMDGSLMWPLPKGKTMYVGTQEDNDIIIRGLGMLPKMCTIQNKDDRDVIIQQLDAAGKVLVQGRQINAKGLALTHMNHVLFGRALLARVQIPGSRNNSSSETESFEQILEALGMSEDSTAWREIQWYLGELQTQGAPASIMKTILSTVKALCPLVDEANEISADLWPLKSYRFEMSPLFDAKEASEADVEYDASMDSVFIKVMRRDGPTKKYQQKYILSADSFATRVPVMRGIFDRFHGLSYLERAEECGLRKSHGPLDIKLDEADDPWADSGMTIKALQSNVNEARDEADKAKKALERQLQVQPEYIDARKAFKLVREPTTFKTLVCCGGRAYHINKRMMQSAGLSLH